MNRPLRRVRPNAQVAAQGEVAPRVKRVQPLLGTQVKHQAIRTEDQRMKMKGTLRQRGEETLPIGSLVMGDEEDSEFARRVNIGRVSGVDRDTDHLVIRREIKRTSRPVLRPIRALVDTARSPCPAPSPLDRACVDGRWSSRIYHNLSDIDARQPSVPPTPRIPPVGGFVDS